MTDIGSRASRKRLGYGWLAAGPVAVAVAVAMFMPPNPPLPRPPRWARDGRQLRGPGRDHGHQHRPERDQRGPRREPGHRGDRFSPGIETDGTIHSANGVAAGAELT